MQKGILIRENQFLFNEFSTKEIGFAKYCKSFSLKLDDIKLIAISPRILLDDESIFVILVDKNNTVFPMPDCNKD